MRCSGSATHSTCDIILEEITCSCRCTFVRVNIAQHIWILAAGEIYSRGGGKGRIGQGHIQLAVCWSEGESGGMSCLGRWNRDRISNFPQL